MRSGSLLSKRMQMHSQQKICVGKESELAHAKEHVMLLAAHKT